ncbi:MAG: hypothetical protein DRJ65_21745 [Acidobacteria bacterium]|nr:MAG: hypothetical protein DRJ65_21745 [Acidobacteriota bacterium]
MKRCPNPDCPDIVQYGVVGEYHDHVIECAKCGSLLEKVVSGAARAPEEPDDAVQFEYAASISNAAVAPIAKSLLESAGIKYRVRNEINQELFGYGRLGGPYNLIVGPVEFWVDATALTEAREVLRELED